MVAGGKPVSFQDPKASGTFVPTLCSCECLSDSPNSRFSTAQSVSKNRVDVHPFPWFGCLRSDGRWVLAFYLVERLHALGFIEVPCRGGPIASGEPVSFRDPEASGAIVPTLCSCEYFSNSPHDTLSAAWSVSKIRVDVHPFMWFGCPCYDVSVVLVMDGWWVLACCLFGQLHALGVIENSGV